MGDYTCPKCRGKKFLLSKETHIDFPNQLCVLDLETYKTDFKNPENSKPSIVGTKSFSRTKNGYKSSGYKYYLETGLKRLNKFLVKFEGLIIGYNIYKFDLKVLKAYFDVSPILKKTVDLFIPLVLKNNGYKKGLSLDSLSYTNFRKKTKNPSKNMPALWIAGKKKKVIEHNKRDCELTFSLWYQAVRKGFVLFDDPKPWGETKQELFLFDPTDYKYLLGKIPIPYKSWKIDNFYEKIEAFKRRDHLRFLGKNRDV